jgi:hypothetical protein
MMRTRANAASPGEDATGGYLVYLGRRTSAEAILGNSKLRIANLSGPFRIGRSSPLPIVPRSRGQARIKLRSGRPGFVSTSPRQ